MKKTFLLLFACFAMAHTASAENVAKNATVTLDGAAVSFYTIDDATPVTADASKMAVFVDGDRTNDYRFAGYANASDKAEDYTFAGQTFILDFGASKANLDLIKVYFKNAYATAYAIEYSTDKSTWTPWVDEAANTKETVSHKLATPVSARYIKFTPKKAYVWNWGIAIKEIEVYESETAALTTFTATAAKTTLNPGGTTTIATSALDQFNDAVAATITCVSSNPGVVTVTDEGEVTAVANGTATVTVKATYNSVTKTVDIPFTVETAFAAPATKAVVKYPSTDILKVYTADYTDGENGSGYGAGSHKATWTEKSTTDVESSTVLHIKGNGYSARTESSTVATEYTTAYVAVYPKTGGTLYVFDDNGGSANPFKKVTAGEWNYVQLPISFSTNYIGFSIEDETELYVDYIVLSKETTAAELAVSVNKEGYATVSGPLNATNKSELNSDTYANAAAFDLTGATVEAGTGAIETKSANAVIIVNESDESKLAGTKNLCHIASDNWLVFPKNGGTAQTITFTDNAPLYTAKIYSKDNDVTYNYSHTFTGYATFSFPAAVEIPSGVVAYEYTGYASDEVTFTKVDDEVTTLTKNTPYVLYAASSATITYSGNATAENGLDMRSAGEKLADGATFTANYGITTTTTDGPQYILNDGEFKKAGGATIGSFRAYFTGLTGAGARAIFGGEGTTGISNVENILQQDNVYYNLNGQRVANPVKGLYIVNGKKVILK